MPIWRIARQTDRRVALARRGAASRPVARTASGPPLIPTVSPRGGLSRAVDFAVGVPGRKQRIVRGGDRADVKDRPGSDGRGLDACQWQARSIRVPSCRRKGRTLADFVCTLPVVAAFFAACAAPAPVATGYVEGEFLLIAPVAVAQVDTLAVRRGDRVAVGATLARMERRDAEIALAQAEAALARAESELADLRAPRRNEEIRAIEAELASARAQADEADREAQRQSELLLRGAVSRTQLDDAQTRADVAHARVAEVEANLAVSHLPARDQQIAAAEAAVAVARSSRDAAAWQLSKREIAAPRAGTVSEVFRRAGEIAGPQAPILSLLPEGAVLLRLYAPETLVSGLAPGVVLAVDCDGCPPGTTATVSYVSDQPEFTPPVIYSVENRQKLVYLIEARPDPGAVLLKPGQIVDVRLKEPE